MKGFIFVCFVAAVSALPNHNVQLTQSQKDKAHHYSIECIKESGVKPELIVEVKKGHFSDDENLKKFTLCFFQKSGVLNHDGMLDVEAALAKLPTSADKNQIKKVLEECKNKKGKDTADTAFEIFKCYYNGTPQHIAL